MAESASRTLESQTVAASALSAVTETELMEEVLMAAKSNPVAEETSVTRTKPVAPSAHLRAALEAIEKAAAAARARAEKSKIAANVHTASSLAIKSVAPPVAQPTAALLTSAQLSLALVASSQLATEPLTEAHPAAANTEAEPVKARTAAESLDSRRMLVLAKKIGEDWESPGKALGLPDEELAEIKEDLDSATYKDAFKMQERLWKQNMPKLLVNLATS